MFTPSFRHHCNINTEVEADPSNWYEPEDGSVIIDMGWGVYH